MLGLTVVNGPNTKQIHLLISAKKDKFSVIIVWLITSQTANLFLNIFAKIYLQLSYSSLEIKKKYLGNYNVQNKYYSKKTWSKRFTCFAYELSQTEGLYWKLSLVLLSKLSIR